MAFLEERLPITIVEGSRGGPMGSRTKVYTQSGKLRQNFNWSRPLQRYDLSFGIKTLADFEAVRSMWYVVMFGGPYEGFRIKDWSDYRVTAATSSVVLVTGTTWQLYRKYTVGSVSYSRAIKKLVSGSVTFFRTRTGVTTTITPTLNNNAGTADVSGHVAGDTYTWEGEFDVPVTFVDDSLDQIEITGNSRELLQSLPSIKVEELPL